MIRNWLRRRRLLLQKIKSLEAENLRLRRDLETAQIQAWIRNPRPRRTAPRADPHPVRAGRHQAAEQTEFFPRRPR